MKRKLLFLLVSVLLVSTLTGCGKSSTPNENGTNNSSQSEKVKGNCTAVECIKKIKNENTVDEINRIIGFDGELIDEKYNIYYWKLSENTGVKMAYYSSTKGTVSIDYDTNTLANSRVNFSRYSELQNKIRDGVSYQEFISYIGNVEGTIVEKSTTSTKYVWVSSDGSYLNGSFSNISNQCTFASGRIK